MVKSKEPGKRIRIYLVLLAFILFSIFLIGLFYLSGTSTETVTFALAYAAGLSMIFLPCTLPLAFVIVPLSMGRGYKKGFLMALLFGVGLTITISLYGVFIALAGKVLGLDKATQIMYLIAGLAAFIFGLSELKMINWKPPGYSGAHPGFIQRQGDYLKALFLGLFLGNVGAGCPNPAFYVLLTYIASTGDLLYGGLLGAVHGIGRATPLIFLSILGILGVNATQSILKRKVAFEKLIGWGLVFIGAFILINGLPGGHEWYEETFIHNGWNSLIESTGLPAELEMEGHEHEEDEEGILDKYIPWIFLSLIIIPIIWYYLKKRNKNE